MAKQPPRKAVGIITIRVPLKNSKEVRAFRELEGLTSPFVLWVAHKLASGKAKWRQEIRLVRSK
jgi:hypothetical protein